MKSFIKIVDQISIIIAGMILSSAFIDPNKNWKYYASALLILITIRNFVKD